MPTIKTSYVLIAAVVLPLIMSKPQLDQQAASMAPVVDYRKEQQADRREDSARASEAKKDSRVALDRAKLLCTPVVAAGRETAAALEEGGEAIDDKTGLPLAEDSYVCTSRGSTARMENGRTVDVRSVTRDDFEEYSEFFKQQFGDANL